MFIFYIIEVLPSTKRKDALVVRVIAAILELGEEVGVPGVCIVAAALLLDEDEVIARGRRSHSHNYYYLLRKLAATRTRAHYRAGDPRNGLAEAVLQGQLQLRLADYHAYNVLLRQRRQRVVRVLLKSPNSLKPAALSDEQGEDYSGATTAGSEGISRMGEVGANILHVGGNGLRGSLEQTDHGIDEALLLRLRQLLRLHKLKELPEALGGGGSSGGGGACCWCCWCCW